MCVPVNDLNATNPKYPNQISEKERLDPLHMAKAGEACPWTCA